MKISFVILSFNNESNILKAIKSIRFSNIPVNDYEIIVVDDGSTDNTTDLLKSMDIKLYFTNNGLNTKNQSLGRNIGIKNSSGDYIRFLDGDDYFNPIGLYEDYLSLNDKDLYFVNRITITENSNEVYKRIYSQNLFDGIGNYYISRKVIFDNDIFFDEIYFNWHNEDVYFFIKVFDIIDNYSIINSEYSYVCIKRIGSNSDISSLETEELLSRLDYVLDLYNELKKNIKKRETINLLQKIIDNITNNILNKYRSGYDKFYNY